MANRTALSQIEALVAQSTDARKTLQAIMALLKESQDDYHWVGIYKLEGETLVLGPYVGPHTDHERIPVGRGVCGTAVATGQNQVIDDVRELDNYLACNLETRSEIVVLIYNPADQSIVGQIDVDGTVVRGFDADTEQFLADVARHIAPLVMQI